jgi:hypothetical protein
VPRPSGRRGDFISASGNFNTLGAFFCNRSSSVIALPLRASARRGSPPSTPIRLMDQPLATRPRRRSPAGFVFSDILLSGSYSNSPPPARREGTTCRHINLSLVFQKDISENSQAQRLASDSPRPARLSWANPVKPARSQYDSRVGSLVSPRRLKEPACGRSPQRGLRAVPRNARRLV